MAPAARLYQGDFADFDFLLSDNFARAAFKNNLKKIIYVSGMIPESSKISPHLESRLEVETTLKARGCHLTSIRCGIVIGPEGSSFRIITNLVEKLPMMLLPAWIKTQSQPVYVKDLAKIVIKAIAQHEQKDCVYDVGIPEVVNYRTVIELTAKAMNKTPLLIDIPYVTPHLSKIWIWLVTGSPLQLVSPLISSIHFPMLVNPKYSLPEAWGIKLTGLAEAIEESFQATSNLPRPRLSTSIRQASEVKSVQRMVLPSYFDAHAVAVEYLRWLPRFFRSIIKVETDAGICKFKFFLLDLPLLVLVPQQEQKRDRFCFSIESGLLVSKDSKGVFEFRLSPDDRFVFASIQKFRPALPWWIYRITQAVIHKIVMNRFGRHLLNKAKKVPQRNAAKVL